MKELIRFDGKRVLVVGCYSGMGATTAALVRELGGEVFGIDHREPTAAIDGFALCDLRAPAQIDAAIGQLTMPIDCVFYCAGLPQTHPPLDVMRVNLLSMIHLVERVLPAMSHGSAIAIISSNGGMNYQTRLPLLLELIGTGSFEAGVRWCEQRLDVVADGYTLSKEAVIAYTMQKAVELTSSGIRVNCISPGPTTTPMMPEFEKAVGAELVNAFLGPMNRKAEPREQAWPLVFLNSDAASFITGLNVVVDGGFLAGVTVGAIDVAELFAAGNEALAAARGELPLRTL